MDQINKRLNKLKIQSHEKCNEEQEHYLAGKIDNVIQSLDIALVKPHSSKTLLYFGTPLLLNSINCSNYKSEYILLGYIDDIFGPIKAPMYSVSIKCASTNMLHINTSVYYFPNHPNTLHMYVENTTDETKRNKEKYNIKTIKC